MSAIGRIVGVLAVVLLGADAAAAERTMAELFSRPHTQELLMRMEVALARVQARRGIIPPAAAAEIARTANLKDVPPAAVAEEFRKVGHPMVALLNVWARATKDGAGEWIHYGANVTLPHPGRYAILVTVDPPDIARYKHLADVWNTPVQAVFTYEYR